MNTELRNKILEKMNRERDCPLCSLTLDYEFDVLSKFQYNIAGSEKFRKEIAEEGGFCDFHFRQFKKIASGKTNIVFLKTLLESNNLENDSAGGNCRLCRVVNEFENELIKTEYKLLNNNQEFKEKFTGTLGLCFPHLKQIKVLCGNSLASWLDKTNYDQFRRMLPDFEEMSGAKSFYEIDRKKRELIKIIVEKLTGRKSLGL